MRFSSKRLKGLFQRRSSSFSSAIGPIAGEGGAKPSSERHKKAKMKTTKHTASAVASHGLDVMRELSDVFGPLKSAVNCVGHATNVVQNARRCRKEAQALHSEVNVFRDRVDTMIPDVSSVPIQIIDSLVRLDEELDNIETIMRLLSNDHLGSRILYWKEYNARLRAGESRFRDAREQFSIECNLNIATTRVFRECHNVDVQATGAGEREQVMKKFGADQPLESVLKVLTLLGLFGSYGSMEGPVLNRI